MFGRVRGQTSDCFDGVLSCNGCLSCPSWRYICHGKHGGVWFWHDLSNSLTDDRSAAFCCRPKYTVIIPTALYGSAVWTKWSILLLSSLHALLSLAIMKHHKEKKYTYRVPHFESCTIGVTRSFFPLLFGHSTVSSYCKVHLNVMQHRAFLLPFYCLNCTVHWWGRHLCIYHMVISTLRCIVRVVFASQ